MLLWLQGQRVINPYESKWFWIILMGAPVVWTVLSLTALVGLEWGKCPAYWGLGSCSLDAWPLVQTNKQKYTSSTGHVMQQKCVRMMLIFDLTRSWFCTRRLGTSNGFALFLHCLLWLVMTCIVSNHACRPAAPQEARRILARVGSQNAISFAPLEM